MDLKLAEIILLGRIFSNYIARGAVILITSSSLTLFISFYS